MTIHDADYPFGVFRRNIEMLGEHIETMDDEALGAFIHKAENAVETDRQASSLWRNAADMARRRLAVLEARRLTAGIWVAKAEAVTSLVGEPDLRSGRVLEFCECVGKDDAIIAARKLLSKHAESFDHMTEVRVSVVPEIEWQNQRALAEAT